MLAIWRQGSVSGAARSLVLDQSTVGRRLSAVEAALGTILFTRSRLGFEPTDAGNVVIAHGEAMERQMMAMMGDVYAVNSNATGFVRIVTTGWIITHLLVPALPDFRALHPNVEIRFIADTRARSISRREADLGLWFEIEPADLEVAFEVGKVPYAIYGPAGLSPDGLPWVSFWDDTARRAPMRWLEGHLTGTDVLAMTANDAAAVHQAIRAGVGKGLIPMWLGSGDERVRRLTEGPPDLVRTLHGHAHPDLIGGLRMKAAITWVRSAIASRMTRVG